MPRYSISLKSCQNSTKEATTECCLSLIDIFYLKKTHLHILFDHHTTNFQTADQTRAVKTAGLYSHHLSGIGVSMSQAHAASATSATRAFLHTLMWWWRCVCVCVCVEQMPLVQQAAAGSGPPRWAQTHPEISSRTYPWTAVMWDTSSRSLWGDQQVEGVSPWAEMLILKMMENSFIFLLK